MNDQSVMQLKISLKDVKPPVWRRVLVPTTIRYDQLEAVIQMLFRWENAHLTDFTVAHNRSLHYVSDIDPDLQVDQKMFDEHFAYPDLELGSLTYTYDFGDDWQHLIVLEKLLSVTDLPEPQVPLVIGGRGAARQEDSRGMTEDGYGIPGEAYSKVDLNLELAEFSDGWLENY